MFRDELKELVKQEWNQDPQARDELKELAKQKVEVVSVVSDLSLRRCEEIVYKTSMGWFELGPSFVRNVSLFFRVRPFLGDSLVSIVDLPNVLGISEKIKST